MPIDYVARWGQNLTAALPLRNLQRSLFAWRYSPVEPRENSQNPSHRQFLAKARERFYSKAFWRIVLVLTIMLLLLNLLEQAQERLRKFGYLEADMTSDELEDNAPEANTDWSQFAYCQYVTNDDYLSNSLMIFESRLRVGAKAERLMMYPEQWAVGDKTSVRARLLAKQGTNMGSGWNQYEFSTSMTRYKRVLSMDSDATVLKPMDELFGLPSAPVAMARGYWLDNTLSSQHVLVEPSNFEFNQVLQALEHRGSKDSDMEIVNQLYGESCFILPHRRYDLLTGEFRSSDHIRYLGNMEENWDPEKVFGEAKFLHISDHPYPKPWISASQARTDELKPDCHKLSGEGEDCRDREKWLWFYEDFRNSGARVCNSDSKP